MSNISIKNALVTGGAGFIGSTLVDALVEKGVKVRVFDNLSTGHIENLEKSKHKIEFIKGDIRDFTALTKATTGVDTVFHLAAIVSVPLAVADPPGVAEVNEIGTINAIEAARACDAKKFIFASSCAVYGDAPGLPKTEDMPPEPASPYALQKLIGEQYARLYSSFYGLDSMCLRFFNVFGPRQDPSSDYSGVISIFLDKALKGEAPVIYGDGEQYRDFVFIDDVVKALIMAGNTKNKDQRVYNVATSEYVTINNLWKMISKIAKINGNPIHMDVRKGDVQESCGDISHIRRDLGFTNSVSFEKGLEITYQWYKMR